MRIITKEYLRKNPNHIFVFGDNVLRTGHGGAAVLRDEPNTYGFITKKIPNNEDSSFYTPEEYLPVYIKEIEYLKEEIEQHPDKLYLISKIGSGLANKFKIFDKIISVSFKYDLKDYKNIQYV